MSKKKDRTRRWTILAGVFKGHFSSKKKLVGAEVGVFKGDFSKRILELVPKIQLLHGVDPYKDFSQEVYRCRRSKTWNQQQWEDLYKDMCARLEPHIRSGRFKIYRTTSKKALAYIEQPLDFVFIDGNHSYEYVKQDIKLWEPKVVSGGIVSGHDYGSGFHTGVQKAVDEYAAKHGRTVKYDLRDGVWWWVKP